MPHVVSVEKPKQFGSDRRGGYVDVVDSSGMNLAVVSGTLKRQTPFYEWIRGIEVHPNVSSRRFTAVLLDMERDKGRASVMLEAHRCRRCGSSCWLMLSALTSALTSSVAYTQPFGSDVGWDAKTLSDDPHKLFSVVICWRNLSGILVVLLETVDKASCQRRGLRTTEVKSRHTVGRNGS
jgi:hypothetical protein